MKAFTPSSPLLTLTVEPNQHKSVKDVLAQFHPILKDLGYGNFEMLENGLYQAQKPGNGFLNNDLFAFAEVQGNKAIINIDGHSIFGLKGVQEQLRSMKEQFENRTSCTATVVGPDYRSAFIGNVFYTALPIYLSAALIAGLMGLYESFRFSSAANIFLYATVGMLSAKTRFWVYQRRKNRPVWLSVLILMLTAPLIFLLLILIFWAVQQFG